MNIEHLSHWSGQLNREMYLNRYGHAGIPVVVFASSGGSHNEYYDFGMIDACAQFIEEGRVQFFTLSSVDSESWLCNWKNPHDRAEMHRAYERYVIEEAIPFIKHKTGWFDPMMTTGCSMGAYHALNFFLQHPDVFNKVVALSGIDDALGAWEQDGLPSFYKLKEAFDHKNIPAWFAEWGHDVAHDWDWWRKQMPYFLGQMYL